MKINNLILVLLFVFGVNGQTRIDAVHQLVNGSPVSAITRSQCVSTVTPPPVVWGCQGLQLFQFTLLDGTVLGPYVVTPTTAQVAALPVWQALPLSAPDPVVPLIVSIPVFSPPTGTYSTSQTVTITSTTGAAIYYTLNGTTPNSTTGTLYTGPISVNMNTIINAVAYLTGYVTSFVGSANISISQ